MALFALLLAVPLTLERVAASPSIAGTAPAAVSWSPDSRAVAFLWNDRGFPARDVWLVERSGGAPRRLAGPADELAWMPDGSALVYLSKGDLYRLPREGSSAPERLTTSAGDKSALAVSPDGRTLSYLDKGDLWLVHPGEPPVQATHIGAPPIGTVPLGQYFHDDVEIGGADWGGESPPYAWAPDSRTIAVHVVDRRAVRKVPIPYYLGNEPVLNLLRRGSPGDVNESRDVGFLDVATLKLTLLGLPAPSENHIVDFSWSPFGQLLIDREADTSIDRTVLLAAPGAAPREIWHDHRETRIYNDVAAAWAGDGKRVLLTGDLEDRYRLYLLTPGDPKLKPLTTPDFDVAGAAIALPKSRSIVYVSNEPLPCERHVWSIAEEGGKATRLTAEAGQNTPFVSPDGQAIALIHTDDVTPPQLELLELRSGALRRITQPPPEFAGQRWVPARYVSFPGKPGSGAAGLTLHARIFEPPGLDRARPWTKHPVIIGNVYSNTVRNRWDRRFGTLQQYLVQQGYIVAQVDVRGSTGYGRDFREKFLLDWGGKDLDDLESAVEYLKTLPYVDGNRIGLWGTSYGGLLTVFSLFKKPGLYAAGVAAAPATDPHWYGSDDVAITRTPQTHPDVFANNGAIHFAQNLRDPLLLMHGMEDDIVPFQTSVALAEKLIELGKEFDFTFAPAATHAWTTRPDYALHFFRKLVGHFDRYLRAAPRPPRSPPGTPLR